MKQKLVNNKQQKQIYAFIDSQNLNLGIKSQGWKLDFSKFRNYLRTKYSVVKAFIFIGYIPENEKLYETLKKQGFIVIYKPVMKITENDKVTYKGNVDAELVLHSMIELPNYDGAVIVSGDGDFHCLIEYLDNAKKLTKIITPNKRYSSFLKEYAKSIAPLNQLKTKLGLKESKHKKERHLRSVETLG